MAEYQIGKTEPARSNTEQEVSQDGNGKVVVKPRAKSEEVQEKNRYFEIRVVKTETGTEYSYCFEMVNKKPVFYSCERKQKGKADESLINYAYVSPEKAHELRKELKGLLLEGILNREEVIERGAVLVDNLRDNGYKEPGGVMVYVTPDSSNILHSSKSTGRQEVHPKYVLPGADPAKIVGEKFGL